MEVKLRENDKIKKTAKVRKEIKISDNAFYPGQDMRWTERMESPARTTTEELKIYHASDSKIKSFLDIETCFFTEFDRIRKGFVYEAIIPAGTVVQYSVTGEEVRVELHQKGIKIFEVAEIETFNTGKFFGQYHSPLMGYIYKIYKEER